MFLGRYQVNLGVNRAIERGGIARLEGMLGGGAREPSVDCFDRLFLQIRRNQGGRKQIDFLRVQTCRKSELDKAASYFRPKTTTDV